MSEHDEQVALFRLLKMHEIQEPRFKAIYAVPNAGKRSIGAAQYMKAEGLKAGVWDVQISCASRGYNGMVIEMKYGSNGLTEAQKEWRKIYQTINYKTEVHRSAESAFNSICDYLNREDLKLGD